MQSLDRPSAQMYQDPVRESPAPDGVANEKGVEAAVAFENGAGVGLDDMDGLGSGSIPEPGARCSQVLLAGGAGLPGASLWRSAGRGGFAAPHVRAGFGAFASSNRFRFSKMSGNFGALAKLQVDDPMHAVCTSRP